MKCPFCGELESRVADSRMIEEGTAIKRRRECTACEKRFNTMEKVEENPIMVIKRDGRREVFDGNKILTGLLRASEKRNVDVYKRQAVRCVISLTGFCRSGTNLQIDYHGNLPSER